MTAFIFGSGGHAHVIASVLDTDVTFLVPEQAIAGQMLELEFYGRIDEFRKQPVYVGIGDNAIRRQIFDKLTSLGVTPAICVARHAFVARSAAIGPGTVILVGGVVGARAVIAENCIVNTLSSVDHDCVLGPHSQVTGGVTFGGTVKTGENCFFGIKSAVIPNLTIGDNATTLAGALVTKDVPSGATVGGSPARVVKMAPAQQINRPADRISAATPPLIVLGAGGHAWVLLNVLEMIGNKVLGVVDSALKAGQGGPLGHEVLGGDEVLERYRPDEVKLVNGIGSIGPTTQRDEIYRRYVAKGFGFASVIHPSAVISKSVVLAEGVQIMAGSVVQAGAIIGANTIVNTRASVDHGCRIGETVHIAPGVTLSGHVTVGNLTHIGTGATVIQGITIGPDSMIAAGATVYRDIPAGTRFISHSRQAT